MGRPGEKSVISSEHFSDTDSGEGFWSEIDVGKIKPCALPNIRSTFQDKRLSLSLLKSRERTGPKPRKAS